jgi:hypothetical protein
LLARSPGNGERYDPVGSLDGGEGSAKLNREMRVLVASSMAHAYLADLFRYDRGKAGAAGIRASLTPGRPLRIIQLVIQLVMNPGEGR